MEFSELEPFEMFSTLGKRKQYGYTAPVMYTPAPRRAYRKTYVSKFSKEGRSTVRSNLARDNKKVIPRVTGLTPSLKKAIKAMIDGQLEVKTNQYNQQVSARGTVATGDILNIMPTIVQGAGQGARVGNAITIKRLVVDVIISPALSQTIYPFVCRILIFRWKDRGNKIITSTETASFYENNNSSTAGTGDVSNQVLLPNPDLFETLYDKVTPVMAWYSNAATTQALVNYNQAKYTIDVEAARMKVCYDDNTSQPDRSIFMLVQAVNTNGTNVNAAGTACANVFQNIMCQYTDA